MGWDHALFVLPNQQMQTLKHFECPLCYEVVKNAVGCACGHTFCNDCLKLALNSTRAQLVRVRDDDDPGGFAVVQHISKKEECPVSRKHLTPNMVFPTFAVRKLVGSAKISCPFLFSTTIF
ncbi:hypothetical protein TrLO_g11487 [Triparma laevis f. longispina]|uniref:RING-type domain-containing protein n=1 Tax=Triparma laevis f. longispina TaxID=1714387 RepID=A0A9W7F530_9STRA|nr:hypothetical protein TrLO_g11487 [Triparma laevis f. longispina]